MEALLYLGCTVPIRNLNYELSSRMIARALGINFHDNEALGCCGFPLKSMDVMSTILSAARNLAIAERDNLEICALCNACAGTLNEISHTLDHDQDLRRQVNDKLKTVGLEYNGTVRVRNFMRLLYEEVGLDRIQSCVKRPLNGIKLAPHYGCHYLKPSELNIGFEDPEVPRTLSSLIEATGAQSVDYASLKDCCGGGVLGVSEEVANSLAQKKLQDVAVSGAHALVLVCPFCNVMYEGQQKKIAKTAGLDLKVPVVYYPQVLGLALGMNPDELGFKLNRVKPAAMLKLVEGLEVF